MWPDPIADLRQSENANTSTADDGADNLGGTSAYNNDGQLKKLVTYEEGVSVAKQIGALRYLECSAMKNRGVKEVFTEAARIALTARPGAASVNGQPVADDSGNSNSCIIM
ncbi:hypothetical protein PMKS-001643 [Pichia membranifaciens]|uniref:Uncharacterized protein n=1 Tax=Pichia membranifaciens TaxID=4926 RepID=A0A1Q2YFK6_9ASCO|nr:hypothetical protein PMKS-001643 [Pichia membranifaciens]